MRCSKEDCYSITWSARANTFGPTSSPRALAVLRLMVSSYLVGFFKAKRRALHPNRLCKGLDDRPLPDPSRAGTAKDTHARDAGSDLLQKLQPLSAQAVLELHEAGDVTTRPS